MAQGRGNAKAILCVVALLAFSHAVAARDIIIGGSQKWDFPPGTNTDYYATWSAGTTFAVGDNLIFQYQAGEHDAQEVSASEYASCLSSSNERLTSGADKVPLTKAGDRYFICTFTSHCEQGMKVKVTVGAAAPPATPPATPPTTPPATPPVTPPTTPPATPPVAPPTTPPATPPVAPPTTPPATPPVAPPTTPPVTPPAPTPVIVAPVPAPVSTPTIAPTPVPEVAPPTSVPESSPPIEEPAPASTESPTTSPAPAPGSAHSVRVGFGVVGAAVVAAIGALLF